MKTKIYKVILALTIFATITISLKIYPTAGTTSNDNSGLTNGLTNEMLTYKEYFMMNNKSIFPQNIYSLDSKNITKQSDGSVITNDYSGSIEAISIPENQYAEWSFEANEGLYLIEASYICSEGINLESECSILINGEVPFNESRNIKLNKVWKDTNTNSTDNRGNDISPNQSPAQIWNTKTINGPENIISSYYYFYFKNGINTFRFTSGKDIIGIRQIRIFNASEAVSYKEYLNETNKIKNNVSMFREKIEAEMALYKSSSNLYPMSDHSSPEISPNDPVKIKLNCIGGSAWKNVGQWISWKINVPENGSYSIGFKYKQNFVRGLNVRRKITIDDQTYFKEMNNLRFPYANSWEFNQIGEGSDPYRFYLTKGEHVIKLEVVLGDLTEVLSGINDSLITLNQIYRRIIMITGVTPDPYNDYFLHTEIPEMVPEFQKIINNLTENAKYLEAQAGTSGSEVSGIYDIVRQLQSFLDKPNTIPQRLDSYKSNLSTLAELLLSLRDQPLQLDYISIVSADQKPIVEKSNIFYKIMFRMKSFLASFYENYSTIGNQYNDDSNKKTLDVWISANDLLATGVSSGRDQATILKRFIDEKFTPSSGINVNLNLVSTSDTLLQAVVGGKAPDAAIFVPKTLPLTLAMRGGLDDISKAPQFSTWYGRVFDSAFIPYRYNGGVFGMPETQIFNVLYYRKDIFKDLNLTLPNTWKEFYKVTSILQGKNLQAGISADQSTLEMFLLQKNKSIYNESLSEITLTDPESIKIFQEWTDLYSQYGVPIQYDFFNRFRTGEMPMAIAPLTLYNQLSVAAPEINNEWGIAPIPATEENGILNRSQSCTTTASIVINSSKNKSEAYQFIDWWTSDEIQSLFGNSMENLMGSAARYNTANKNAFLLLPWNNSEKEVIKTLWKDVKDIPQSPASYYVSRNIMNAFRKVAYYNQNPREVITKYAQDMNKELSRKRQEFGIE